MKPELPHHTWAPTGLAPGAPGLLLPALLLAGRTAGPSAGTVRTSRGPWPLRTLRMMTPSLMMSWTTSTPGRAPATLSRSRALRQTRVQPRCLPGNVHQTRGAAHRGHPACGHPVCRAPSERPTPKPATSPPMVTEVPEEPSQSHHHAHSHGYHR